MASERNYTTQLAAGTGMITETMDLLRLWKSGMIPSHLSELAVSEGIFSRATARRTRNIVAEMFAPRYMADDGKVAVRLKSLMDRRLSHDELTQLFYLYTARAQQVFWGFIVYIYWPKYMAGGTTLNKDDAVGFIHRSLDAGYMQRGWSETTIGRNAGYLLSCCEDFGLLSELRHSERTIQRFTIRPNIALYLAYDLHFQGLSDQAVTQHLDWRLFGLETLDVVKLLDRLSHDGHLLIQSGADLVQISWKYRDMEGCLNALTQR